MGHRKSRVYFTRRNIIKHRRGYGRVCAPHTIVFSSIKENEMRLTKRQLKRIIREEYSKINRRRPTRRLSEGEFSADPFEDAYMCVSETAENEPGSKQIVSDLFYVTEQFNVDGLLGYYVDSGASASEEIAMSWMKFLQDLSTIQPQAAQRLATDFSEFWERNYMG